MCLTHEGPEYAYELCLFDKVTQKQGGREVAKLGTWGDESWEGAEYRKMVYRDGAKCWNGPERQTTVTIECGLTPSVGNVHEPEMCKYTMSLITPVACTHAELKELLAEVDRLRNPGVAPKDEL